MQQVETQAAGLSAGRSFLLFRHFADLIFRSGCKTKERSAGAVNSRIARLAILAILFFLWLIPAKGTNLIFYDEGNGESAALFNFDTVTNAITQRTTVANARRF